MWVIGFENFWFENLPIRNAVLDRTKSIHRSELFEFQNKLGILFREHVMISRILSIHTIDNIVSGRYHISKGQRIMLVFYFLREFFLLCNFYGFVIGRMRIKSC